jgi:hypothetical protein
VCHQSTWSLEHYTIVSRPSLICILSSSYDCRKNTRSSINEIPKSSKTVFTYINKDYLCSFYGQASVMCEEQMLKQIVWKVRTRLLSKYKFKATKKNVIICKTCGLDGVLIWFCYVIIPFVLSCWFLSLGW